MALAFCKPARGPHIPVMTASSAETFRVASYNIRKCRGTDRRRDPGRVLSVLADLDADIVALQEADLRLGQRPATLQADAIAARTGLRPVPIGHNSVSLGWHGNGALLFPKSLWRPCFRWSFRASSRAARSASTSAARPRGCASWLSISVFGAAIGFGRCRPFATHFRACPTGRR